MNVLYMRDLAAAAANAPTSTPASRRHVAVIGFAGHVCESESVGPSTSTWRSNPALGGPPSETKARKECGHAIRCRRVHCANRGYRAAQHTIFVLSETLAAKSPSIRKSLEIGGDVEQLALCQRAGTFPAAAHTHAALQRVIAVSDFIAGSLPLRRPPRNATYTLSVFTAPLFMTDRETKS